MTKLPKDFKEFLRLLNTNRVEYLLVGGYAVSYHGYVRATADMDIWVASTPENAAKVTAAIRQFGFSTPELREDLFLNPKSIARMGVPPWRIELLTTLSGVTFSECYENRLSVILDGVEVDVIDLDHLKVNKAASGRNKDLADLDHLK